MTSGDGQQLKRGDDHGVIASLVFCVQMIFRRTHDLSLSCALIFVLCRVRDVLSLARRFRFLSVSRLYVASGAEARRGDHTEQALMMPCSAQDWAWREIATI